MVARWQRAVFPRAGPKLMAIPVKSSSTFDAGVPVPLVDADDPHCSYEVSPDGPAVSDQAGCSKETRTGQ